MYVLEKVLRRHIWLLKKNGVETAERDALLLLSFGLGFNDNEYSLKKDILVSAQELNTINDLVHRRAKHEPVAKIIGKKLFWNSSFYVDGDVLDPRPDTEILVQSVLSNIGEARNILDLGTGTGCVGISLDLMLPNVTVVASDISDKALKVARLNSNENGAEVEFILSDWLKNITRKFDIIVSNPPYISSKDFHSLPLDVKKFDPPLALLGGEDGLECYRTIAESLATNLTNDGRAFFEIGYGQKENIVQTFYKAGFALLNDWKDFNGLERVICVKKVA